MKIKLLTSSLLMAGMLSVASAGKFDDTGEMISSFGNINNSVNRGAPNSSVTLDFGIAVGESWDGIGDPSNVIANCVTGTAVTGIEWTNVVVESVGASWLSEASLTFSDSSLSGGIRLRVGQADGMPGVGTYSSGGIIDFTDNALPDVVSLADGQLPVELSESFDDVADAIDANYTGGTVAIHGIDLVPTANCPFIASDSSLSATTSTSATGAVDIGTDVAVTITVTNGGPGAATTLVITDTLSSDLIFVSGSCDDGTVATEAGGVVTFAASDLANGATLVCTVNETVNGFGALSNDIVITSDNNAGGVPVSAPAVVNGPARIIPANNWIALLALMLTLGFFGRKLIKE